MGGRQLPLGCPWLPQSSVKSITQASAGIMATRLTRRWSLLAGGVVAGSSVNSMGVSTPSSTFSVNVIPSMPLMRLGGSATAPGLSLRFVSGDNSVWASTLVDQSKSVDTGPAAVSGATVAGDDVGLAVVTWLGSVGGLVDGSIGGGPCGFASGWVVEVAVAG